MTANQYFVTSFEGTRRWDIHDPDDIPMPDCVYLGGALREFERHWEGRELTVYLTRDTTSLPSYGPDVVSLLMNEEWFRTPAYSGEVLAVIRNLPATPYFPWETLAPPDLISLYALANHLRVLAARRSSMRDGERIRRDRGWAPVRDENSIDVPLGYYRQPAREIVPIEHRTVDLYFAGSLAHDLHRKDRWKRALKQTVGNPKSSYRRQLINEARTLSDRHPEIRVKLTISGEFRALQDQHVEDYAYDMMNARIALVPRGTAAESYRLFEAWRYGCVVICEPLPVRSFLQGAPVISMRSWSHLEEPVLKLLSDPERLAQLHRASLQWWSQVCSESPVGRSLARRLHKLTR